MLLEQMTVDALIEYGKSIGVELTAAKTYRGYLSKVRAAQLNAEPELAMPCPTCRGEGRFREGNMIAKKKCPRCLGSGKVGS